MNNETLFMMNMSHVVLCDKLNMLAVESTKDNYLAIIIQMDELVRNYVLNTQESNKDKLIKDLSIKYHQFDGEEFKEEVVGVILDRLSDYCSPSYSYKWKS